MTVIDAGGDEKRVSCVCEHLTQGMHDSAGTTVCPDANRPENEKRIEGGSC